MSRYGRFAFACVGVPRIDSLVHVQLEGLLELCHDASSKFVEINVCKIMKNLQNEAT